MSEPGLSQSEAAAPLHDWFQRILRLIDRSVLAVAPAGPHRGAVILDVLTRNARVLRERVLRESALDREGNLYSPLCIFLAAGSRKLGVSLGAGHWRAAVDNVVALHEQLASVQAESKIVGMEIGSPARLFKHQLDEATNQAGLAGLPSYLDRENRDIALGLAIHWGIRLLLAYALDCGDLRADPDRKDLAWIAGLVAPLLPSGSVAGRGRR